MKLLIVAFSGGDLSQCLVFFGQEGGEIKVRRVDADKLQQDHGEVGQKIVCFDAVAPDDPEAAAKAQVAADMILTRLEAKPAPPIWFYPPLDASSCVNHIYAAVEGNPADGYPCGICTRCRHVAWTPG